MSSLQLMQLDYIDLMLLHSPGDPDLRPETWRALEDLHQQVGMSSNASQSSCEIQTNYRPPSCQPCQGSIFISEGHDLL